MLFRRRKAPPDAAPSRRVPEGVAVPRHLGDIWQRLEEIAREEDPRFREVSVVDHYNSSGEGARDVLRWLEIYQRRLNPAHQFSFPAHHPRHRGYCLVERTWPQGLRWEAFDEETWFRAPLPPALDKEGLIRALDEFLDGAR